MALRTSFRDLKFYITNLQKLDKTFHGPPRAQKIDDVISQKFFLLTASIIQISWADLTLQVQI